MATVSLGSHSPLAPSSSLPRRRRAFAPSASTRLSFPAARRRHHRPPAALVRAVVRLSEAELVPVPGDPEGLRQARIPTGAGVYGVYDSEGSLQFVGLSRNIAGSIVTHKKALPHLCCSVKAARYDDIEDVVSLYSVGVSLDARDSLGRTALHMAAANGHLGIVEYLLNNGADVNMSNLEGNTPLHWACLNGHIEVVKTLIVRGAETSRLNSHERTPVDEAVMRGKLDVIDAVNIAVAQAELDGVHVASQ